MATFATIKAKLETLRSSANQTTGEQDTTLTDAVTRLQDGFCAGKLTGMANPASESDVVSGKEYIGEDGFLHTGNIPERSENDVSMMDGGDFVQAEILAGYYPNDVSKKINYTAGNALISPMQVVLSENAELFGDNLAGFGVQLFTKWHDFFQSGFGVDMYYLPMTIGIMVGGSPVPIEGAFIAASFDAEAGRYSAAYGGNSVIGGYYLSFMVSGRDGHDVVTNVALKENGELLDVSSGLPAVPIITSFI